MSVHYFYFSLISLTELHFVRARQKKAVTERDSRIDSRGVP